MNTLLSFVIPCYRSELTIEKVIDEIREIANQREGYDYEIVCVNDCSPDNVYEVLKRLAEDDHNIKVINFARNMGKHSAIIAAYADTKGDYIFTVDDDFQCPVYEMWKLLEPLENNEADFSTAKYPEKKESAFKKFGSHINLLMTTILLEKPKSLRFENFSCMKRFVAEEIVKYDNPYPYIDGLIYRTTHSIVTVPMEERERADNRGTGFTFFKSFSLWMNGLTAFSVKPLRISSLIGALFALIGFVVGVIMVVRKIINPEIAAGYTSMMAMQLFIGGLILLILGLIGEYIGRIYICLNNSPQYVIKEKINFQKKEHLEEINE